MNVDFKMGKHVTVTVDNLEEEDLTQGMSDAELFQVINTVTWSRRRSRRPDIRTGILFFVYFLEKRSIS